MKDNENVFEVIKKCCEEIDKNCAKIIEDMIRLRRSLEEKEK